MNSMNIQPSVSTSHDQQITSSLKSQKKRGKINIVACDRCKRDKKKCDGNYLTQKSCKYCHNHNETCVYSEPNYLRIARILNAARRNAAAGEEREDDSEKSIQELEEQITKYENHIISLINQLENKNMMDDIGNLYLSLFANPQISNEQTIILKKLCEITNNANLNIDSENINKIRNKMLILSSNDSTELEKGQAWEELDKFINDNLNENIIIPLPTTNIFGFSYPSGSTTPIPSPQFLVCDQFQNNGEVTTPKKRNSKKFEPYPSGGRISIRPSRKETNMMIWHQNDPSEDVPIIAVHAPQNNIETEFETIQNSNIQFDIPTPTNENIQFQALLSPHESYGFDEVCLDEVEQFSNITSPSNSISDDNLEFPAYLSNPSADWLFYQNSTNFNESY